MSDLVNDLCSLGDRLGDAADTIGEARRIAERILQDVPAGAEDAATVDWPAMGALVDKLEAISRLIAELPGDELAEAIRASNEEYDEMSDRADGLSY